MQEAGVKFDEETEGGTLSWDNIRKHPISNGTSTKISRGPE